MEHFFFCVTLPETILSGRMACESAMAALQALESMHPNAIELHIRKHKVNARNQTIAEGERVCRRIG